MESARTSPAAQDIQHAIAAELHRRKTRYDTGPTMSAQQRQDIHGELIGLRVALGIALGHTPHPGADGIRAANDYYTEWLGQQSPRTVT